MLFPHIGIHASYAAIVECAYLCLLSVTTDVETLQVDEQLLSHGHIGIEVRTIDTHDDGSCGVLDADLLIQIATLVITVHHHLQLPVVSNLLHPIGAGIDERGVFLLQFPDGDDLVTLLLHDGVVAIQRLIKLWSLPVLVHAGSESHGSDGNSQKHISCLHTNSYILYIMYICLCV